MTEGIPFVRIRTHWSDDGVTLTGHLEEWFANWVLALYADASLWTPLQRRPVRAKLFGRIWMPPLCEGLTQ